MTSNGTPALREPNALRRYELLSEHTRDIVVFIRPDGRILEANRAAVTAYGYTRDELLGMRIFDLRADGTTDLAAAQIAEAQAHGLTFETVHRRKDGSTFPVEVSASPSQIGGVLLSLIRDITRRKRVEATQALLREIDHQILNRQHLPVILQTVCDRLAELFGYTLVWIALKQDDGSVGVLAEAGVAREFLHDAAVRWDETPAGAGPTGTAIRTGQPRLTLTSDAAWDLFRERTEYYGFKSVLSLPLNAEKQTLGALTIYAIAENAFDQETTAELGRFANQVAFSILAARDQEQLRLRTAALDAAANAVVITDRDGAILWVNRAFTDLTGYTAHEAVHQNPRILKSGNQGDQFYHQMWETVLAGGTWRGELYNRRKDGSLYAEEMTITPVRNESGEITHFIAIKQDISERKRQEENLRQLAIHDPVATLADRALYSAEAADGKEPAAAALSAGDGEHQWRDALAAGRFVLHFQPVVRLATERVEHHEALLRLQGDDGTLVLPGAFLPAVQRAGLMGDVDLWVLSRVLELLQADPTRRISVNLAESTLTNHELVDRIVAQVRSAGPAGLRLGFEVAETIAVRDLAEAQQAIWRLRGLGCRFALATGGTGFTSLSYLGSLPVDCVKLAGPLMRHLDTSPVNRAMVQAVTGVSHSLGREVVAEWVESGPVADVLKSLGIEYGQGYYFGSPGADV